MITIENLMVENKVDLCRLSKLDKYTLKHSHNVLDLAYKMGQHKKLSDEQMNTLLLGAVFHDVGKQFISQEVLNKPGKLTEEEFEIVKSHSKLGYEFMKENSDLPDSVLSIILDHHERPDGKGYPANKVNNEISELTKIVSICDVYNALVTDRVYRKAMSTKKAFKIMLKMKGKGLDKNLVDLFFEKVVPNK